MLVRQSIAAIATQHKTVQICIADRDANGVQSMFKYSTSDAENMLCVKLTLLSKPVTMPLALMPIWEPIESSGVKLLLPYPALMRLLPVLNAAEDRRSRCPISDIMEPLSVSDVTLACESPISEGNGRMLFGLKDNIGLGVLSRPSSSNT